MILSLLRHWQPRSGWALQSRSRPQVEVLEDRLTPAAIAVTTRADVVDDSDGKLSLREAITQAGDMEGPDTIVLLAGVYEIAIPGAVEDGNATGDFDVSQFLTIKGKGASSTFIDAGNLDRVFSILGNNHLKLFGVTLRNGFVPELLGGGILVDEGELTLTNSTVSGNAALVGGGIFALRSGLTLNNSRVTGNVAGASGGGIGAQASLVTLNQSRVSDNGAELNGGGIFTIEGELTLTNSTVHRNRAGGDGGGIHGGGATAIDFSTISENTARSGGGLFMDAELTLERSTLHGNRAFVLGGGLFLSGGDISTLANVTLSGNTAADLGGGLFNNSSVFLRNVTVTRNVAEAGGGVFNNGNVSVVNTLIAQNHAMGGAASGPDVNGHVQSEGHNLFGLTQGSSGWDEGRGDVLLENRGRKDAGLKPLADNGGPTLTHALRPGSLAIDHSANTLNTDQRGVVRPRDGDGDGRRSGDIGAFER